MAEHRWFPLPPDLAIDRLTAYIFKHYESLLNDEERALQRLHIAKGKSWGSAMRDGSQPEKLESFFRVDNLPKRFPALAKRLETSTIAAEMTRARDRVLRDNDIVLNKCPRCGELCLTPKARACLDCGHTWHSD